MTSATTDNAELAEALVNHPSTRAIVAAVTELARLKGMKTPVLDTVLALTRQRAKSAGCY